MERLRLQPGNELGCEHIAELLSLVAGELAQITVEALSGLDDQARPLVQASMGWVALAGTEALSPFQETAAPSSLSADLLHWGTHHAAVGELLASTDPSLSADETEAQDWATRAVRIHGNSRIISWVPGPSTEPGFTTLHGSGVPR